MGRNVPGVLENSGRKGASFQHVGGRIFTRGNDQQPKKHNSLHDTINVCHGQAYLRKRDFSTLDVGETTRV